MSRKLTPREYVEELLRINERLNELQCSVEGFDHRYTWWELDLMSTFDDMQREDAVSAAFDIAEVMVQFVESDKTWPDYDVGPAIEINYEEARRMLADFGHPLGMDGG